MPLFLKNYSGLDFQFQTRAIDAHRANLRLLKCALRLAQRDKEKLTRRTHTKFTLSRSASLNNPYSFRLKYNYSMN